MNSRKIVIYASNLQYAPVQHLLTRLAPQFLPTLGCQQANMVVLSLATEMMKCLTIECLTVDLIVQPNSTDYLQAFQACEAAFLLIQPADLPQVTDLTRAFVAAAAQAAKLAWVALACPDLDTEIGKQLAASEALVRAATAETLVLRHAPLFSDLLWQKKELKFRRILSLPLGTTALPWLAPEAIAESCCQWLLGQVKGEPPQVLTGAEQMTGAAIAQTLSQVLQHNVNGHTFAQRQFAAIDRDQSGQIDLKELSPHLLRLGYSLEEAQTILESADTDHNHLLDFEEFMHGLEKHLDKILAEVPTTTRYVNVDRSTSLYDLMVGGMDEAAANAWLDVLTSLTIRGLPDQWQELAQWLGQSSPLLTSSTWTLADWAPQYALDWINVHILPGWGILTLTEGILEGRAALITRLLQASGRLLISQRTLDFKAVTMRWADADIAPCHISKVEVVRFLAKAGEDQEERLLQIQNGHLIESI